MQIITGGVVSFEDGVKSNIEYQPPRKVRVELRFDIPEGLDGDGAQSVIDGVAEVARRKVYDMLAQGPSDKDKRAAAALVPAPKPAAVVEEGAKAPAVKRGPRTNAEKAGEDVKPTPVQTDIEDFTSKPAVEEAKPTVVVEDDEFSAAPAEITDADLNKIAQNAVIRLNEAGVETPQVKIREIVASYNPDPTKAFQMKQIPQAQRADFKAKVEALKGK